MRKQLLIAIGWSLVGAGAVANEKHWGYEGDVGPPNWGKLSADNVMCDIGRNQSPINIEAPLTASVKALQPVYATPSMDIVNNGHSIQVGFQPGNVLTIDGVPFQLKQMHFHSPSENRINGQSFPLEGHLVHADAQGNLAVLAVMFKEGKEHPGLARLRAEMPASVGPAKVLKATVTPKDFMPASLSYYRYSGSLTTPPCSEGVRWLVLKDFVTVSPAQVEAFSKAFKHKNNRPLQPVNGRVVVD